MITTYEFYSPQNDEEEQRELTLIELQEELFLLTELWKVEKAKDKRKKLRTEWRRLSSEYNTRVKFEAYQSEL